MEEALALRLSFSLFRTGIEQGLSAVVVGLSSLSVFRPCQSFVLVSRSSLSVVRPCQSFVLVCRSSLSVVRPCHPFVLVSRSSLSVVRSWWLLFDVCLLSDVVC